MEIIVVDDEPIILEGETAVIRRVEPEARVTGFHSAEEALQFVSRSSADVAFLDIEMPECSGVELARKMKALLPRLNIIFATAYNSYYEDAMRLHASGYLVKPVRENDVRAELKDLRHPCPRQRRGVFFRTFGNFEVFENDAPVLFRYQKTKEMLAYLVDRRGALVTRDEMLTILWGGELDRGNYYKQIQKDLNDTMKRLELGDALVKQRGSIGLRMDRIRCDYFDWLEGRPDGLNAYRGEYMRQYDWAESTWMQLEGRSALWTL